MSTQTAPHVPVRTTPFPGLPARFDGKEAEYLLDALKRNNLFYNQPDGYVSRLVKRGAEALNAKYAVATSSGTASIHAAIGAVGVEAGGEVITSPITDMGTCIAILYQNAIPVFADVDPHTYNITAASIEAVMTPRTKAVVVVHLTGNPADMKPIVELCRRKKVALVEDCAQGWGAKYHGRAIGNEGQVGAYSLNNYKHLSCGDGGLCIANDEQTYYNCHNFADKFYDRANKGVRLTGLAPNYRMSELQGAVALAQFDRLDAIVSKRRELGDRLSGAIRGVPGVEPPRTVAGGEPSYWFYMFRIDAARAGMSRDEFANRLNAEGIGCGKGYIAKAIHQEPVFQTKNFFAGGVWPAEVVAQRTYDYTKVRTPICDEVLATSITLSIHEGLSTGDVDDMAKGIRQAAGK